MEAAAPEKLLEAFKVLDPDNLGYLRTDYITKIMMDEGEPFTQVITCTIHLFISITFKNI